jgi:hypothetical protein
MSQTEVVVTKDFGFENTLLMLELFHLGSQLKSSIDIAPVDSSPGNGER